jgi:hypothetical protein
MTVSLKNFPDYKTVSTDSLIPYARNSRTHSDKQVAKIAASIKEFGFLNPIIVDGDSGIIAGHGRVLAAQKLGLDKLPCIEAKHLTNSQRRAYVIADNRLALDAGWDEEMLRVEFAELEADGFDISITGFELGELEEMGLGELGDGDSELTDAEKQALSEEYNTAINAPIYEMTGEKPNIGDLYDSSKSKAMIDEIMKSNIPEDEKAFLIAAAHRHTVIRFDRVAEFYAHSSPQVQNLMEKSALVIIDYDKAIENGYIKMNKALLGLRSEARDDEE